MTNKIKLLFIFLAATAVISVASFFDFFHSISPARIADSVQSLPIDITLDADQDGLSDNDESYWETDFKNPDTDKDGFLDGEEITSGHDPTKPGPDDIQLSLKTNLSEKITDLAIAGLIEGSLKPGSPDYDKSLSDIAEYAINDTLSNLLPPDLSGLAIVDSSKENQNSYAKKTKEILRQLIQTANNQAIQMESSDRPLFPDEEFDNEPDESFLKISGEFKDIYKQALQIAVPDIWRDFHLSLLTTLYQLAETNRIIAQPTKDPIAATIAYNIWGTAYENIPNLLQSFSDMLTKENLINDSTE